MDYMLQIFLTLSSLTFHFNFAFSKKITFIDVVDKRQKNDTQLTENKINFRFQVYWLAWLVSFNILLCRSTVGTWAKNQLCEVETGQTNIILDIEESRGSCKY